ncbi:MAG: putative selenate ABC transporter substrate-binding protein [Planctomycetota bacterium]|nr:MAG: putative selenate ABC transporter substrate-binding protein [Planctomycetota bacterium]
MRIRSLGLALLFGSISLCASCGDAEAGERPVLRFTVIPDSNNTDMVERLDPFARHLAERLQMPVEFVPTPDYNASVEAFKNGDVQLAWFGGLTGVQARRAVPGAQALAQGSLDPHFKSYFVAHKDTGLTKSEDFPMGLKGRRFTFGSADSTSGRLMPEYFIRQHTGMSPEQFFGRPNSFSNAHDKTAKLVEAGSFEAGAMNFVQYDQMVREGKLDPELCRVIWVTPEYVDYQWTVHPKLEDWQEGLTAKLQKVLLQMDDPAALEAFSRPNGFIAAKNEDYSNLAKVATELGF